MCPLQSYRRYRWTFLQISVSIIHTDTSLLLSPYLFPQNRSSVVGISFNQPKLCPSATWNPNGNTFADNNTIGIEPQSMFVSINNTVYVANHQFGGIRVWVQGSASPTSIIDGSSNKTQAVFVNSAGDFYFSSESSVSQVRVWHANSSTFGLTLVVDNLCSGLFIDTNDSLYCSMPSFHRVIKRSLNSNDTQFTIVAGKTCQGYTSDMLYGPTGIFVTINYDLYVADTNNHRIQLFPTGQPNGTTIAGSEASGTILLVNPIAVVLDADNYVFIVDWGNHRIVGSGPDGFRCVLGCGGGLGASSNQFNYPRSIAFDSHGNIFVLDTGNHRVQKFFLTTSSCSKDSTKQR